MREIRGLAPSSAWAVRPNTGASMLATAFMADDAAFFAGAEATPQVRRACPCPARNPQVDKSRLPSKDVCALQVKELEAYACRMDLRVLLHGMLSEVLKNQPDDPAVFLAHYLQSVISARPTGQDASDPVHLGSSNPS